MAASSLPTLNISGKTPRTFIPPRHRPKATRVCGTSSVASAVEPGSTVLVAGSTGGIGQLLTARLLETGYHVKAVTRNFEKATQLFGQERENLEIIEADLREKESLKNAVQDVDVVCCVVGTTAFPSQRWEGNNNSKMTDKIGVENLITVTPDTVKRFILTSSAGVLRADKFPFVIMNLFKILTYKRLGEQALETSGLPYTIFRPSRLTDGPYTSYDLNTLLKATRGARNDVHLSLGDCYSGEASRITVAEAIVQSLRLTSVEGHAFCIESTLGEGPDQNPAEWAARFASV